MIIAKTTEYRGPHDYKMALYDILLGFLRQLWSEEEKDEEREPEILEGGWIRAQWNTKHDDADRRILSEDQHHYSYISQFGPHATIFLQIAHISGILLTSSYLVIIILTLHYVSHRDFICHRYFGVVKSFA